MHSNDRPPPRVPHAAWESSAIQQSMETLSLVRVYVYSLKSSPRDWNPIKNIYGNGLRQPDPITIYLLHLRHLAPTDAAHSPGVVRGDGGGDEEEDAAADANGGKDGAETDNSIVVV